MGQAFFTLKESGKSVSGLNSKVSHAINHPLMSVSTSPAPNKATKVLFTLD